MYYIIKKIGSELEKRFLGYQCQEWADYWGAFKFPTIAQARVHLTEHENVVLLWVDESDEAPYGKWGEVHPSVV